MDETDTVAAFEHYLQRRFPERRTTIDYLSDVRQFRAVCAKPWREVTMHDIDAFVDQQWEAQLQASTIKRRVAALKTYFDFLAEDSCELGRINPVRFKRHAGKQPQRLPRDLSNEAVEQLWAVIAAPRDRAWFALMLRAGWRVGEVARLQLGDVLTPAQADHPARVRVLGKGQKERIVLLTADAYAVLNDWLAQRPASTRSDVFLNERGQPLTTNGLEWLLHQYSAQVGLVVTPHQLRHTYARQLTEAGMPLPSLSKLMGPAHLSTTQLYTVGADPELSQAYQTAMHQLATQPLADPAGVLAQPVNLPDSIGDMPLPPSPNGLIFTHRCGEAFRVKELPSGDNIMQALKAAPEHRRAGLTVPRTSQEAAELRDPAGHFAQSGRRDGRDGDLMDKAIEGLPFVDLQDRRARQVRHLAASHRQVQHLPRHHTVQRQIALQAGDLLELTRFDATATFENFMIDLNQPAGRIPFDALTRFYPSRGGACRQQQPLDCLHVCGRQVFANQNRPDGHWRQMFRLAMAWGA